VTTLSTAVEDNLVASSALALLMGALVSDGTINSKASLDSPAFTGTPKTNSHTIATPNSADFKVSNKRTKCCHFWTEQILQHSITRGKDVSILDYESPNFTCQPQNIEKKFDHK
jgi:hypothetical protein